MLEAPPIIRGTLGCLFACLAVVHSFGAGTELDAPTEALINQLPQTSETGFGYSGGFGGAQFLPLPDSGRFGVLLFGSEPPKNSPVLEGIVRKGIKAIPSLLKHLDDERPTKIPPASGMMWTAVCDEYDFNRRVRKDPPKGVNLDMMGGAGRGDDAHTITVGDLCFVALGQIVNRDFNAIRYQPTAGLVISSPTSSKHLCAVARADFAGMTEEKHRELLIQDFQKPDNDFRMIGACERIFFYYPQLFEPLVLKQFAEPKYNMAAIYDFVTGKLYRTKSKEQRKIEFDKFVHDQGPAASDGILLELFHDLELQQSDENHTLTPPLKEKYDARATLIQLYGYPESVKSTDRPYVESWSDGSKAMFIESLTYVHDKKIDDAISDILAKDVGDDYLALVCMRHLLGRGYDQEIRSYCQRRIPLSNDQADELRKILKELDSKKTAAGTH